MSAPGAATPHRRLVSRFEDLYRSGAIREVACAGRRDPPCPDADGAHAPYLANGILEPDNNTAERGMRAFALGRKNHLFVGSEVGGTAAAIAHTLIETAKLNDVDPQAWSR